MYHAIESNAGGGYERLRVYAEDRSKHLHFPCTRVFFGQPTKLPSSLPFLSFARALQVYVPRYYALLLLSSGRAAIHCNSAFKSRGRRQRSSSRQTVKRITRSLARKRSRKHAPPFYLFTPPSPYSFFSSPPFLSSLLFYPPTAKFINFSTATSILQTRGGVRSRRRTTTRGILNTRIQGHN